ncbi:uncharacterized protein METZ01_LOCUS383554, partial [marine metagenome]
PTSGCASPGALHGSFSPASGGQQAASSTLGGWRDQSCRGGGKVSRSRLRRVSALEYEYEPGWMDMDRCDAL